MVHAARVDADVAFGGHGQGDDFPFGEWGDGGGDGGVRGEEGGDEGGDDHCGRGGEAGAGGDGAVDEEVEGWEGGIGGVLGVAEIACFKVIAPFLYMLKV